MKLGQVGGSSFVATSELIPSASLSARWKRAATSTAELRYGRRNGTHSLRKPAMNRPRLAAAILLLALLTPALRGDNASEAAKLITQAREAERDKRYADAVLATKQAIQLAPDKAEYHGMMGWLCLMTHDYATGVKESETAAK